MKRILIINFFILIALLSSGFYKNIEIANKFDSQIRNTIYFSSTITLILTSLFNLLILFTIFWIVKSSEFLIKKNIANDIWINAIFNCYIIILVIEILRIILTLIFLSDDLKYLPPDESILKNLQNSLWAISMRYCNYVKIILITTIFFLSFRDTRISIKENTYLSSVLLIFLSFFLI
jgi:hypothetical protein